MAKTKKTAVLAETGKKFLDSVGTAALIKKIKGEFVTRDEFEYVPIAITSFTNNKNTVEIGTKITDVILNWALNKDPKVMVIDSESITPLTTRTKTYSGQNITTNKTYTLKVTDEKDASATKTTSITFLNGVYWGAKAAPGSYDSAFILGLTKGLQGSKGKTFTVNAAAEQHIFYALPSRYGSCVFNVGGFDGGFTKVSTIEFTNASGYKENYDIYKSVNAGLGNTTVTVK
ncbi:hypothetical protein [Thomasclavelia spiroformis]|uniref:hypothetical protein n=1 Tax=Thomasclavelia spiroformis TaxID=29348 RepID=UPI0026DAB673|nr:hypothetical protein [Thomasclavelia spiroformis]